MTTEAVIYSPSIYLAPTKCQDFPGGSVVKNPLGREEPLEEKMATHSSILAWKIPWTEEPGGLQSMVSQRARHDLATKEQLQRIDKTEISLVI